MPTANVGCWIRRAGWGVRLSTMPCIWSSCRPSIDCSHGASRRHTSPKFFEAARAGRDLRDALGLDAAILRPRQPADGVHLDPREYADASAAISETIGDCADSLASEAVSAWRLAPPGVVGAEDLIGLVTGRVERLMRERLSEAASTASGCEPKLTDQ